MSSSSQAARGSPSRGWPTLPGLISQRPSPISRRVPAPACQPRASGGACRRGRPRSGSEEKKSATCEWPIEAHPPLLDCEAVGRLVGPEHVLPDRIAGRGVVERGGPGGVGGMQGAEEVERSPSRSSRSSTRPQRPRREEKVEVSSAPEHREVVVADQARLAALRTRVDALVGARAVADHVSEAPELVDLDVLDVVEHRLEGRQIRVDVAEDGYSHGRRRSRLGGPDRLRSIVGADEPDADAWQLRRVTDRRGRDRRRPGRRARRARALARRRPAPDPAAVEATSVLRARGDRARRGLPRRTAQPVR